MKIKFLDLLKAIFNWIYLILVVFSLTLEFLFEIRNNFSFPIVFYFSLKINWLIIKIFNIIYSKIFYPRDLVDEKGHGLKSKTAIYNYINFYLIFLIYLIWLRYVMMSSIF